MNTHPKHDQTIVLSSFLFSLPLCSLVHFTAIVCYACYSDILAIKLFSTTSHLQILGKHLTLSLKHKKEGNQIMLLLLQANNIASSSATRIDLQHSSSSTSRG
jgi:hypothetical protein